MNNLLNAKLRKRILENLSKKTFCRLGISKLAGVGVLAIKKIPNGIDPFQTIIKVKTNSVNVPSQDIEKLDPNVRQLVKDFFMLNHDDTYPIYANGFNDLDIAYYLNHSETPNLDMVYDYGSTGTAKYGEDYYTFKTVRDIDVGEELTINYYQHARDETEVASIKKQFNLP